MFDTRCGHATAGRSHVFNTEGVQFGIYKSEIS